jgi:hypothetical protein
MNTTHPLLRRVAAGVGISLLSMVALAAMIVPGGALEGRATSLRIDEPAEATTTTTVMPIEQPAPAPDVTTTTTTVAPATVTTEIGRAATVTAPPPAVASQSGHFVCPGGMAAATQFDGPDCTADVSADPGPNPVSDAERALTNGADGDQPGQTLGSTDADYGADLTAKSCAIKPWLCGDGWTD